MYRQYENPFMLQDMLAERQKELEERKKTEDIESLIDLMCDIEELKQRINFAWQDDEYDSMED